MVAEAVAEYRPHPLFQVGEYRGVVFAHRQCLLLPQNQLALLFLRGGERAARPWESIRADQKEHA